MRKNICIQHGYSDCPACLGDQFIEDDLIVREIFRGREAEFIPTGAEDGLTPLSDADPGL